MFNNLLDKLGANTTYTKPLEKVKKITKVKDNIPLHENYNYMADLLFLPETKEGYKYCLVVVDLATNAFDIETIKNKEPISILTAFKAMFKRQYIKLPYSSVQTDGGNEFKSVFHKYLFDNDILHKTSLPYRHTQMANVESLNKQLGLLFNGYMNGIEEETGKVCKDWTPAVTIIRDDLNKLRLKKVKKDAIFNHVYPALDLSKPQKYDIGDIVYHALDHPVSALGIKQSTSTFRTGDYRWSRVPRKVKFVVYYTGGKVPYRYILQDCPNVSYTQEQLMPAKETVEKYTVKKILDRKKEKNKFMYLVWWNGFLKKNATWEPKTELIKDVPELIDEYDKTHK